MHTGGRGEAQNFSSALRTICPALCLFPRGARKRRVLDRTACGLSMRKACKCGPKRRVWTEPNGGGLHLVCLAEGNRTSMCLCVHATPCNSNVNGLVWGSAHAFLSIGTSKRMTRWAGLLLRGGGGLKGGVSRRPPSPSGAEFFRGGEENSSFKPIGAKGAREIF